MRRLDLRINKEAVLTEVAKTTAYEGAKTMADGSDYDRLLTTDEDSEMLERFWVEACDKATERMKRLIDGTKVLETGYEAVLKMSDDYDDGMTGSIETGLQSYAVAQIVSKWLRMCKHLDEAGRYETDALNALDEVMRKLWHRKRPMPPRRRFRMLPDCATSEQSITECEQAWCMPGSEESCRSGASGDDWKAVAEEGIAAERAQNEVEKII